MLLSPSFRGIWMSCDNRYYIFTTLNRDIWLVVGTFHVLWACIRAGWRRLDFCQRTSSLDPIVERAYCYFSALIVLARWQMQTHHDLSQWFADFSIISRLTSAEMFISGWCRYFIWKPSSLNGCDLLIKSVDPLQISSVWHQPKGALCSFCEDILIRRDFVTVFMAEYTNWPWRTKPFSHRFTVFGGPCHLSGFKQCSGDLIFLWEQLVYSLMEKINTSDFVLLPHYFCK